MKKIIYLVTAVVFVSVTASAQTTYFGVRGGLNIASINNPDGPDGGSKLSAHVGGLAHIHLSKQFAFQPELVFSGQGSKNGSSRLSLTYLNIPLMGQLMVGDGFRFETGPQLGFLLAAKAKNGNVTVSGTDGFSTVDFGWGFGAGYLFPEGIGVGARYNLGISDITDGPGNAQNRVFQLGLFYHFATAKNSHK